MSVLVLKFDDLGFELVALLNQPVNAVLKLGKPTSQRPERIITDQFGGVQFNKGDGVGLVALAKPLTDSGPFETEPVCGNNGVLHNVAGEGTVELAGYFLDHSLTQSNTQFIMQYRMS